MNTVLLGLGAASAAFGFVFAFFVKVEEMLRGETKTSLSSWLMNKQPKNYDTSSGVAQFNRMLDDVCGKKYFSARSILVSFSISSFLVVLLFVVFNAAGSKQLSYDAIGRRNQDIYFYAGLFLINLVADFISLAKTRFIVRLLIKKHGSPKSLYMFIDLLLGTAVYLLVCFTFLLPVALYFLFSGWHTDWSRAVIGALTVPAQMIIGEVRDLINADNHISRINPLHVLIMASSVASLWYFIYVSAAKTIRFAGIGGFINRHIDVEKHPLWLIGIFAGLFTATGSFILTIAGIITK